MKGALIKDCKEILKQHQSAIIKWTVIIIIAACAFYLVYPKYSFRFPAAPKNLLYKANKITGTVEVEVYYRDKGRWQKR